MELMSKNIQVSYTQEEDCCGRTGEHEQWITAETHDGGGGVYVTISTERWAVSDRAEAHKVINRIFDDLGVDDDGKDQ